MESNSCYVQVTDKQPEEIIVDVSEGIWRLAKMNPYTYEPTTKRKIGGDCRRASYNGGGRPSGVIGVFDRTKLDHISTMVHVATEVIRSDHSSAFDE